MSLHTIPFLIQPSVLYCWRFLYADREPLYCTRRELLYAGRDVSENGDVTCHSDVDPSRGVAPGLGVLFLFQGGTYIHTYNTPPPRDGRHGQYGTPQKIVNKRLMLVWGSLCPLLKRMNHDPIRGCRVSLVASVWEAAAVYREGVSKHLCQPGGGR